MRRGERGLTAIEMTIAVAITGLIIVYVYRSVDALTQTARVSDQKMTAAAENFRGLRELETDLRMAVASPTGPYRYIVGLQRDWVSYHLLDGDSLDAEGNVLTDVSPRIFVFRDGTRLLRAVVGSGGVEELPIPPEAVLEIRVIARHVAEVEFLDPQENAGSFAVRLTTLVGDPKNDRHVQTTNYLTVRPVNKISAAPPSASPEPFGPSVVGYVPGSRRDDDKDDRLVFKIENTSSEPLIVNGLSLEWFGDVAFYDKVRFDKDQVWKKEKKGGRAGTGEIIYFNKVAKVEIAPGQQVEIRFEKFRDKPDKGEDVEIGSETSFNLTLTLGNRPYATIEIPGVTE